MTWKIELIPVPVTDVDRAKAFYERVGFNADHDHRVHDGLRFVQLTPPGSACSIVIGGVYDRSAWTSRVFEKRNVAFARSRQPQAFIDRPGVTFAALLTW